MKSRTLKSAAWLASAVMLTSACATIPASSAGAICLEARGQDRASYLAEKFEDREAGVMVVAHRGCWRGSAENSISAVEACIEMGVDIIEVDIRETADGALVVIHDTTLDRTTNGSGPINTHTLEEIRSLKLKSGAGGSGATLLDEKVPTLEEVLLASRGNVLINFDAKDEVRRAALDAADRLGMLDQVIIKARATSAAQLTGSGADYLGRGYFMPIVKQDDTALSRLISGFAPLAPEAIEVLYDSEDFLIEAGSASQASDMRIWVNTMWDYMAPGHSDDVAMHDPAAHWGVLIDQGVSMIQTDRAEALVSYLKQTGLHCRASDLQ